MNISADFSTFLAATENTIVSSTKDKISPITILKNYVVAKHQSVLLAARQWDLKPGGVLCL